MNGARQAQLVEAAKAETGWLFGELPWFSAEEIPRAERRRRELLEAVGGALSFSFGGTKPHLGPLSPGCRLCGTPAGVFHFINRACTRTCSFCPEDRTKNPDLPPWTDGLWFEKDEDFLRFVETFQIRSVGFTGGEPLLTPDRLISRIRTVKERAGGDGMITRIYTNGDLADEGLLRRLREAGLDEIRINIAARGYDLEPVARARGFIPVVTIEIPAIPEDVETVKAALLRLDAAGVDYVNLIQLEATRDNFGALNLDRYHVLPRPELLPVFESELGALELMAFREKRKLRLPVSYCGFPYRFEVTNAQRSLRYNRFDLKGWEEVTEAGFIRTLGLKGGSGEIAEAARRLGDAAGTAGLWRRSKDGAELSFHPRLLDLLAGDAVSITVRYEERELVSCTTGSLEWRRVALAEADLSPAGVACWRRIGLGGSDAEAACREFERSAEAGRGAARPAEELALLRRLVAYERLDLSFPEPLIGVKPTLC
jgi:pyruvate formate-lyase activating enzyme-like uncharacterized protein